MYIYMCTHTRKLYISEMNNNVTRNGKEELGIFYY